MAERVVSSEPRPPSETREYVPGPCHCGRSLEKVAPDHWRCPRVATNLLQYLLRGNHHEFRGVMWVEWR